MIDLHNDLITYENLTENEKRRRIEKDITDGANVCYALFLGGQNARYLNSFSWAKYLKNLSIEDIGGIDDFVDILPFSPKFVTLTWNGKISMEQVRSLVALLRKRARISYAY